MTPSSTNHGLAAAETVGDDALASEIAPAMLAKLKQDGSTRGRLSAIMLIVGNTVLLNVLINHRDFPFQDLLIGGDMALTIALLCLLFALPPWFEKRSVSAEVQYRHTHGKWRWDR